uniref:Ligand dependent nuclear receptor corepressor-like n=1 Tax=Anabas testudineus TaxID=64144 RepID=A0A3Q1J8Q9_ANATE
MATVQCCKCTAERKGFRRELDSWRHKLIQCVGFESILEGIYGQMLLRDLNLFDGGRNVCTYFNFCLSALVSSSLDVSLGCDSNIPMVAQELMKKMIHQFAMEYASKCLLHTSINGVTTRTSSPLSETSDAPLDLTVSRTQEEKESLPEPGRKVVSLLTLGSAISKISNLCIFSSSSFLPTEELGALGQRGGKCHQRSALDAVLSSLCPAHCSLLYQILKLAHQEKLLYFCRSVVYHPGESKSNCSVHHYSLQDCKSTASLGSSYCCVQRCRMETYTVLCPKRLHCISCQSLAVGHINNLVCSFTSSPSLSNSSSLCTSSSSLCPSSSVCCNPSPPPLSPVSSDVSKKTDEKPPSLLHHGQEEEAGIIVKNGFDNSCQHEGDVDTAAEVELQCRRVSQAEQNQGRTLLQDVMNRFNPPLVSPQNLPGHADAHLTEIITKVLHKGSASDYNLSELFNRHDSTEPKSPNTRSRRRQEVHAAIATPIDDASTRRKSLTIKRELASLDHYRRRRVPPAKRADQKDGNVIVTTSHTSSDSNLVKKESKTQMEEGVEPLNVLSTKSDRDEGHTEAVKQTEKDQILKTEEKEREISREDKDLISTGTQIPTHEIQSKYSEKGLKGDSVQTQLMTVSASLGKWCMLPCEEGGQASDDGSDRNPEAAPPGLNSDNERKGKDSNRSVRESQEYQSNHSMDERRSKRNIVPPQRFSSYVTEPRKMFFVACFDDGIFNKRTRKGDILTSSTLDALSKDAKATDTQPESRNEASLSSPEHTVNHDFESTHREQTVTTKEESPADSRADCSNGAAKPFGSLRSSSKRLKVTKRTSRTLQNASDIDVSNTSATCAESPANSTVQYTSPIKLMFVSPVKNKEGVRYSLKSAGSGSSAQAEEHFDPCEVSSWSGMPEKHKKLSTESATSRVKSVSSPLNQVGAGEVTPTKRVAGTECQKPCDSSAFHETTPPKRRPGRPKKLGPQLEQKAKRPIGRPRKQKAADLVTGAKTVNPESVVASDTEENVNKNLKVTVVYGRSRRNKRMVLECFDQLQTEFHDAWQAVGLKSDLGILVPSSKNNSGVTETTSAELPEQLNFVSPKKESALQSSSNIKCHKQVNSIPSRKPGRPAKVKISGISVTVTTVSPRQRKIQIIRDALQSPETLIHKKVLLPEFKSAKEPGTISHHSSSRNSKAEKGEETKDEDNDQLPNQPLTVRHSMRVRKPSIHFLHALATSTSRSYSHSNALLRRSKKLLLNKASNERKKEEQPSSVETSGGKKPLCGQKNISRDLSRVAGLSVDSIFTPKETLRWWAPSAEEKIMNQELARRIRLISDTWVSNTVEDQEKERAFNSKLGTKSNNSSTKKSKNSSAVRSLFDCSPNKPRSCSMQQLCSWFMQTTETQSLAIVKKASSRNPYELMHFPRSVNKKSICHSPQAERLRKHIKKFAKTVPISPLQHQQAQRRLKRKNKTTPATHRRKLFTRTFAADGHNDGDQWRDRGAFSKYQAILFRARTRFLNQKERERWQKKQRNKNNQTAASSSCSNGHVVTRLQSKPKALRRSVKHKLSDCLENSSAASSVDQTQEPVDVPKEQNIYSKAWSPETLKECRVFLRKINSPDNESTEEEWNSCTVTLDDGSPSAYLFPGRDRELVRVVQAVKTERKRSVNRRTASRELVGSVQKSVQEQDDVPVGRQKGKYKSPGLGTTEAPPAKMLRQSRMRGLTGPRWCDFVFGKYPASFTE